jgi:hypothetical protein
MSDTHIALEVSRDEHYKTPYLKSLKESWPSLAKDYRHYCHNTHPKAGEVWAWMSPEGQRFYHLILDEEGYQGTNTAERLHNFKRALKNLKKLVEGEHLKAVHLPKIGFHFNESEINLAQSLLKEVFLDSEAEVKFV